MILLASAPLAVLAEETPDDGAEETAETEFPDELIVGHPTITKGDFFTELFGNDTADIDVRALIHGYNLVNWDQNQGTYVFDPSVVEQISPVEVDEYGNHTYKMVIYDDLFYSDGTPITAWDYAFSILLMMSPEIEAIGGKIYRAEHLLGYDDYIKTRKKILNGEELDLGPDGDVLYLSGVEVHDDYEIWFHLDSEFLPYFFETGLMMTVPYPISVIAPGCKVYDDGFGIYLGNEDKDSSFTASAFTPEMLQKTILDPETGYNSHPSVVSGPYTMVSWDEETGDGHYQINPYFKGAWFHNNLPGPDYSGPVQYVQTLDPEGNPRLDTNGEEIWLVKPTIEKIKFVVADNDTMIQQLADGELHLVNKVDLRPDHPGGHDGERGSGSRHPLPELSPDRPVLPDLHL
jgi:Bacterial extracellular solute-binding proteins, family 5 Middle.